MSLLFAGVVAAAASSPTTGRRLVLSVGSDVGLQGEVPLVYAEKDAEEFARLMQEVGDTRADDVILLRSPSPETFLAALKAAGGQLTDRDTLIVYYSGHGSSTTLHLAGQRLERETLTHAVAASPAPLKVMIIDACREDGTLKGFGESTPLLIDLQPRPAHEGLVVIQSTRRGETAYELPGLRGGVFSYFFRNGLRGPADYDHDGRVSLSESYDYAYNHTRVVAAATPRGQTPELDNGVRGRGPLILTRLQPSRSRLFLPEGANVHYIVFEKGSYTEFADAWGQSSGLTQVALPAGQFVVHRATDSAYGVAEVTLPFGGVRILSLESFHGADSSSSEWSRRGGHADIHPLKVGVGFGLALDSSVLGGGVTLNSIFGLAGFLPMLSVTATRHDVSTNINGGKRDTVTLAAGVQYRALFSSINTQASLVGGPTVLHQELSSLSDERRETDTAVGFATIARVGVALPVAPRLSWELNLAGTLRMVGVSDGHSSSLTLGEAAMLTTDLTLSL